MSVSSGVIVGIALGGSVGFIASVAVIVLVAHRWKYGTSQLRKVQVEEQGIDSKHTNTIQQNLPFPEASLIARASYVPAHGAYEPLPSNERFTHPAHRTQDSTASSKSQISPSSNSPQKLSTPDTRRNHGERGLAMRTLQASHLSAIFESPTISSKSSRSNSRGERHGVVAHNRSLRSRSKMGKSKTYSSKAHTKASPPSSESSLVHSSEPCTLEPLFAGARLPSFRKSVMTEGNIGILTERCFSEPSLLSSTHEGPFDNQPSLPPPSAPRHCRSTSILKQGSGTAPSAPIPPLPLNRPSNAQVAERPLSPTSISSVDTHSSAILGTDSCTPQLTAREDFSLRNQGMNLAPQLRQLEPDHIRDELVLGSRPSSRQDDLLAAPGKPSKVSSQQPTHLSAPNVLSANHHGDLQDGRSSRLSTRSAATEEEHQMKQAKAVSTPTRLKPKRRSPTQKTSATGSPVARKGPCESVLQDVSGNVVPLREISGISTPSFSSLGGTHQSASRVNAPGKNAIRPSSMKGGSTARAKGHKRSNTVRVRISPVSRCIENKPTSGDGMHNNANTSTSSEYAVHGTDSTLSLTAQSTNVLSTREVSTPSLMSSSPTLSPRACRYRSCLVQATTGREASSSPTRRLSHTSASSSTLLKNFPETPGKDGAVLAQGVGCHGCGNLESPSVARQYSEPEFVPPGLSLAKLAGSIAAPTGGRGVVEQSMLQSSPPQATDGVIEDRSVGSADGKSSLAPRIARSIPRSNACLAPHTVLSPTPKSLPTTSLCGLTSTSPPVSIRPAPLSSTVNPFNTKPNLPPPYTTSPPIIFTPSSPTSQTIPPNRPRPSPGQSVLSQARELRRSRMLLETCTGTDTVGGIDEDDCDSPSQEQLHWMRIGGSSSPSIRKEGSYERFATRCRLTPGIHVSSNPIFAKADMSTKSVPTGETSKTYRVGGIWTAAQFSWDEGKATRADSAK